MLSFLQGFLLLISLICGVTLHASQPGGLKFHGSEEPINQRTSYNVFGNETVEFSDIFSINFNVALYPTTEIGYLIRIKNKQSNRIYNLFYDGQGNTLTFRFNEEGKSNLIAAAMDRQKLLNMDWFSMKISFDLKRDSIHLTIDGQTFSARSNDLPNSYSPEIVFGRSDHIIDVPSFAIRDLWVRGQESYYFPLKESQGDVVHNSDGKVYGRVVNPEWLVNDAYHWRFKAAFRSRSIAGANYNPVRNEIYYFNRDTLFIYNSRSGHSTTKLFPEPCPVQLVLGTNFVNDQGNKLYSYELYNENNQGPSVATLDLDNYSWTAESSQQLISPLHHHGSFYNPVSDELVLFGGFGRMRYSKDFYAYDVNAREWKLLPDYGGDFLSPRYFSSVGYLKETNSIYIFGGMGNESGEQTVGRKYYYDLYKIDLNTNTVEKLWEISWDRDNVVPVRGMVILNDSSFYTLCYPEHVSESLLKLYRFSMKDGSYEILGDSIPIHSDKITTNANLYYDSALNNLFAVVQEFEDDISSDLKVYSLSFPPLTTTELATYSTRKSFSQVWIITATALLLGIIGFFVYRKRRTRKREKYEQRIEGVPAVKPEPGNRANSVYLFGDFTVRDKNGRDITYMFSTQLKQIFCLVLHYSTTDDGISSQKLSNVLWPDKPADKVKNSRGVTINHLRKALSELDGVELKYDKGHFRIEQRAPFYCDYTRCIELITNHQIDSNRDEFIQILSRGKFLQLTDHPLFDAFKEEVEKKLEPVLVVELEKSIIAESYPLTMILADAIFNIDPLNDVALTYQLKAMQKLELNDEARVRYQAFSIEYKKAMGTDYPHPYRSY